MTKKEIEWTDAHAIAALVGVPLTFLWIGLLVASQVLLRGWTMATLWGWFVADKFGVVEISILHAAGLYILARVPFGALSKDHKTDWFSAYIGPPILVGAGWLIVNWPWF